MPQPSHSRISFYSLFSIALILSVPSIGWVSGQLAMTSLWVDTATMKPITVVCFLLLSIGLWLYQRLQKSWIAPLVVCGLATLMLSQFIGRGYLDQKESVWRLEMSSATQFLFLVLGMAFWLMTSTTKKVQKAGSALLILAIFVEFMALVGFLIKPEHLHLYPSFDSYSVGTALCFGLAILMMLNIAAHKKVLPSLRQLLGQKISFQTFSILLFLLFVPVIIGVSVQSAASNQLIPDSFALILTVSSISILVFPISLSLLVRIFKGERAITHLLQEKSVLADSLQERNTELQAIQEELEEQSDRINELNIDLSNRNQRLEDTENAAKMGSWEYFPQAEVFLPSAQLLVLLQESFEPEDYSLSRYLGKCKTLDRSVLLDSIEQLKNGLDAKSFTIRFKLSETETRYFLHRLKRVNNGLSYRIFCVIIDVTPVKKQEHELQKIAQRLKIATSSAGIGIWEWNLAEQQLMWSDEMFQLYQIDPKEEIDFSFWEEFFHPDDYHRMIQLLKSSAQLTHQKINTSFKVILPSKQIRHIKLTGEVILAENGSPEKLIGINSDITEEVISQTKIAESEANLNALFNSSEQAYFLLSPDFELLKFNKKAQELFKKMSLEPPILGNVFPNQVFSDQTSLFEHHSQRALSGEKCTATLELYLSDKKTLIQDAQFLPVYFSTSHANLPGAFAFSATDITEKIENQNKLFKTLEELRNFRNAIDQTFITAYIRLDGSIQDGNDNFLKATGMLKKKLHGHNLGYFLSFTESQKQEESLQKVRSIIAASQPFLGEVIMTNQRQELVWYEITLNPLYEENNTLKGFLLMGYSISTRKQIEQEREQLIKILTDYAFITAHKIRGPLARILGLLNVLNLKTTNPFNELEIFEHLRTSSEELDSVLFEMAEAIKSEATAL